MKKEQQIEQYAVIKTGGKQYLVSEGDNLDIEKIDGKEGDKINFDKILLIKDKENLLLGFPLVEAWIVKAQIIKQFRGEKIRVAKFRAKSRYRRVQGHRQSLTKIKVLKIEKTKPTKRTVVKKRVDSREK